MSEALTDRRDRAVDAQPAPPDRFPSLGDLPRPGWGWWVVSCSAVVVCAATGLLGPALPLLLALGATALVVVTLLTLRAPVLLAMLAVLAVVLAVPAQNLLGPIGGALDEAAVLGAFVAMSARRLVVQGRLVALPGLSWFAAFAALGIVSAWSAGVPVGIAVTAALGAVKGVLLAFGLAQAPWRVEDLSRLARWGLVAAVVAVLCGLVNLAAPGAWAQLTTGSAPMFRLGGLPALNGPFQHPAAFSRFLSLLAVGLLAHQLLVRRSSSRVVLLLLCVGLAFLTLQSKSIGALGTVLVVMGLVFLRPLGAAVAVALAPAVALGLGVPLGRLVGGDVEVYATQESARLLLTEGGADVADRYFPLGAGFGRWGSAAAAEDYSPLYYTQGFEHRYGLDPGLEGGRFLNDTQWPAIYGEAGWIGAVCFAAGLLCAAVALLRRTERLEPPVVRWMRVTGLAWLGLLVIESVAAPVFVSAPSFPFVLAGAGIVASLRDSARRREGRGDLRVPSTADA